MAIYSASELLPVFGRFSSGELETRLKPCLRSVCQFLKSFVRPNYQFGEAVHYRRAFLTWLRLLAHSVWELCVPIYVIRNARPTDRHFSFMSHDFSKSSNLIGLPVFGTCYLAQPSIPTLNTRSSLPLGGGVWARD